MRRARGVPLLAAAAGLVSFAVPFLLGATAWPEIATPAFFTAKGWLLYDQIFFPHTPFLILTTALAGSLFGFSAETFRAIPALALAAAAALLVCGVRPHRASLRGPLAGLLAGVPLLALLTVYAEGPALWPEPFLAPFLLGGVLLLERHERTGVPRDIALAGLVFGASILVKQTSACAALGAFAWLLSRRTRGRSLALFAGAVAAPYVVFVLAWAACFRTFAHVRWTLLFPLTGLAAEIRASPDTADLHEAIVLFLPFPALALFRRGGPPARLRSPAALVALASLGMAWPRWGLLHLAAMTGLAALAGARAILLAPAALRRALGRTAQRARQYTAVFGTAVLAAFLAVGLFGAGPLLVDGLGKPLLFWDDETTRLAAAGVRARVPEGGELLVFGAPHQTLYPLTRTFAPGRLYVNPSFWYCLNKDRLDERLVEALRARPGLLILFREPTSGEAAVRRTAVYAFVTTRTDVVAATPGGGLWRVVRAP